MTKREIIQLLLKGEKPPYVPWSFTFTKEAEARHGIADDTSNDGAGGKAGSDKNTIPASMAWE